MVRVVVVVVVVQVVVQVVERAQVDGDAQHTTVKPRHHRQAW